MSAAESLGSGDGAERAPGNANMPLKVVGRYALFDEIAAGGMATVHIGRLLGPVGFARTVAIKRLHPQYAKDPEFAAMFLDEARLAARIRHPNVVATLDVVALQGELFLVMEYVEGETLARLMRAAVEADKRPTPRLVANIVSAVLQGLHAAHEATSERGEPLGLVHRDVSPQNVLVGSDGVARVLDFGVAKAAGRVQTTQEGQIKGKLAYMAPEQLSSGAVTRKTDVFAASIVLWEALAGRRLFQGSDPADSVARVLTLRIDPPSKHAPGIGAELDAVVMKGLQREPEHRFPTALEMAAALEHAVGVISPREIGHWMRGIAGSRIDKLAQRLAEVEGDASMLTSLSEPPEALETQVVSTKDVVDGVRDPGLEAGAAPRGRRGLWIAGGAVAAIAVVVPIVFQLARGDRAEAAAAQASVAVPVHAAPSSPPVAAPTAPAPVEPTAAASATSVSAATDSADAPHGSAPKKSTVRGARPAPAPAHVDRPGKPAGKPKGSLYSRD